MRADQAAPLGIRTLGDLARHQLPQRPTGIDHGLAYETLAAGRIAATDISTTDTKIAELQLTVLEDLAAYFPRYGAVLLYRLDAARHLPAAWRVITQLEGRIDAATMIRLNGEAELKGRAFTDIAATFVAQAVPPAQAAAVAAPAAARQAPPVAAQPRREQAVMALVGALRTVPSLALLAMLIPLLGRIGTLPALVALTLYALLPIVRNTCTGLGQVPQGLRDAGTALGFTPWQRWCVVDLPLAAPVILAGAIPAAVLALITQGLFELGKRWLLRRRPG